MALLKKIKRDAIIDVEVDVGARHLSYVLMVNSASHRSQKPVLALISVFYFVNSCYFGCCRVSFQAATLDSLFGCLLHVTDPISSALVIFKNK